MRFVGVCLLVAVIEISGCARTRAPQNVSGSPATAPNSVRSGFDVEELAPGVYAEIRREPPGLAADCNVLFIVNDDDVFVVDTNDTPGSARESIAALKKLTSKPVRYVVNTHWHDDHVMGNRAWQEAYPAAVFLAHDALREYLPSRGVAARSHLALMQELFEKVPKEVSAAAARGESLEEAPRASTLSDLRRRFAGDSGVRKVAFDNYVAGPSVVAAYREAEKRKRAGG